MTEVNSYHHPEEQDFEDEIVKIETSDGNTFKQEIYLLRVYPTTFNGYDAYMDMPRITEPDPRTFQKIYSPTLDKSWKVITPPQESPIEGYFRGDYTSNNPPAWIFGLKELI